MSLTRSSLLAATALFALATGLGPAAAADDGYDNVFSSVFSAVGLTKSDPAPDIDYRERPALVLPPKMELAKPVAAGTGRPASWPQDPDVLKRRKAAEEARAPIGNLLGNRRDLVSRDELAKAKAGEGITAPQPYCGSQGNARGCLVISPEQLKAEHERYASSNGSDIKKELQPGEEPDRQYLTQPPKGYLALSKAVKATTEAPKPMIDEANPSASLVYRPKPDEE